VYARDREDAGSFKSAILDDATNAKDEQLEAKMTVE
jgi:hypothetical protein